MCTGILVRYYKIAIASIRIVHMILVSYLF